jgi:cell division septation protein DedD
VTEAAATNKTKTATSATATATTTTAKAAANTTKPASGEAKTPEKPAQVASAKAPDPAPGTEAQKAAPSGVRIQLVSMPSEQAAWAAWKQLSGKYSSQLTGLTAMVEPADLGDKGKFYRVQTGPFTTVAAAQERCTAMKAAGLDCLVVGKP